MWGKIKETFNPSELTLRRELKEAEERAERYMRLADEAEARGDERAARQYEEDFMRAMNDVKTLRKEIGIYY